MSPLQLLIAGTLILLFVWAVLPIPFWVILAPLALVFSFGAAHVAQETWEDAMRLRRRRGPTRWNREGR